MRNVTSKRGCTNKDCKYALLILAMEVVSFILDLLGGSHWGYLLASFLLSAFVLETTIYAFFIKRSRIKSEAQQLIAVEIVFSVLQLIMSCYCLIRTLSGVKNNYSSSVFPLAYASISVVFTFKSKKDVSNSSSNTPSNQSEFELANITVVPQDTPTPFDNVDELDQSLVSVPTSDAKVDPLDPASDSVPASDAQFDTLDPTLVSVPTSDAKVGPLDPTSDSVPTSDAQVDPLDPTLVSVPTSSAIVPQANMLHQRRKLPQYQELVFKVDLCNDKARDKAMRKLSRISGVDSNSFQLDTKEKKLTLIATREVDTVRVAKKLRKRFHIELISVGPAEQPKTSDEKQSVEKLEEDKSF